MVKKRIIITSVVGFVLCGIVMISLASGSLYSKRYIELQEADLRALSAQDYLQFICADHKNGNVFIEEAIAGWPSLQDVPYLLSVLDDERACRSVSLQSSSYYDRGISTVGGEAQFLLLGIMVGRYPPELNSTRHSLVSTEDIRLWAEQVRE